MDLIINYGAQIIDILAYVIAIAAIVAAATPNEVDNKVVAFARKLIDFLAINFGHAENKPDRHKPKQ